MITLTELDDWSRLHAKAIHINAKPKLKGRVCFTMSLEERGGLR